MRASLSLQSLKSNYKLDIVKLGKRRLWVHKDSTKEEYDLHTTSSGQITSCCPGDVIEISVNLLSLQGLVDIDSVDWR
jgi:hypothetical protein